MWIITGSDNAKQNRLRSVDGTRICENPSWGRNTKHRFAFRQPQIGRALALKLALGGFEVVCCTTSDERFASLQEELGSLEQQQGLHASKARVGTLTRAKHVEEGARYKLWAVGKYDPSIRRDFGCVWCREDISRVRRHSFMRARYYCCG